MPTPKKRSAWIRSALTSDKIHYVKYDKAGQLHVHFNRIAEHAAAAGVVISLGGRTSRCPSVSIRSGWGKYDEPDFSTNLSGQRSHRLRRRLTVRGKRLRTWVRRAERDAGKRAGLTTDERQRLKELERENRELKRANEILLKASAFFAQAELDRRPR